MSNYKPRLLVVDDEAAMRISLSMVLTAAGYRVRTAEDGFDALEHIRRERPDMLISDLEMPGMSGLELLSVVRRRFPSMQVIAMSGTYLSALQPSGIAADDFHYKGSNFASLIKKLESLRDSLGLHLDRTYLGMPVWIPRMADANTAPRTVIVTCPECLRTFPLVFGGLDRVIQNAQCVHCANLVAFAEVQSAAVPPRSARVGLVSGYDGLIRDLLRSA